MISDEVAANGLTALSVAAVMLIEDAVDELATTATDWRDGRCLAASLAALGADLSALGEAAAVLGRRRGDDA